MRKLLLISAVCAMTATATWAQSSKYDTAKDAVVGENTATVEGATSDSIVWKYTADKDYIATVSPLSGKYDYIYVSSFDDNVDKVKDNAKNMKGVNASSGSYYYPFKKGTTYYMVIQAYGDTGFNLKLDENSNLDKGLSTDNPLPISLTQLNYLGDPYKTGYDTYSAYATYTATENGQLVLNTYSYTSVQMNGNTYTSNYDNATSMYKLKFGVEEGKKYDFTFSIYSPTAFTAEMTYPEKGSADMPFDLTMGENTVPKDNKVYYYTFTPTKAGYFNITSKNSLPGGSVKIYSSLSSINYGQPLAQSETGSFDVRTEITKPMYGDFQPYYILVDKVDKTDAEDTFTAEMEDYKTGETEDTPIAISEIPSTQTLPSAQGTYYYSVTVPADSKKFLNVKTGLGTDVVYGTEVAIYPQGQSIYSGVRGTDNLDLDVTADAEQTYIIKVTSKESKAITFTVSYRDIQKGDLITNPADAKLGDNTISGDGTKYYIYTTTRSGKLQISGTPDMNVEFPMGTGAYDGTYETKQNGVNFFISAEANKQYYIKIYNAKDGDVFTLVEEDFKAGEDRTNPIAVESDEITLNNENASNLWLEYTAKDNKMLEVYCDAPYDWSSSIEFGRADAEYLSAMLTTVTEGGDSKSIYKTTVSAKKGDKFLVHVGLKGITEEYKITFTERDYKEGESVSNPLVLEEGKTVTITSASYTAPIWVKARLGVGTAEFTSTDYLRGSMFASIEDAQNSQNANEFYFSMDYSGSESSSYYKPEISKEADYYLMFTSSYDNSPLTLVKSNATVTGINTIGESENNSFNIVNGNVMANGKVDIYSINGSKVATLDGNAKTLKAGIYVINCNGKTQKIIVK